MRGDVSASPLHEDLAVKLSFSNAVLLWDVNVQRACRAHVPAEPTARIVQDSPSKIRFDEADGLARELGGHPWLEASRWIRDPEYFFRNHRPFEGRSVLEPLSRLHRSHALDVARSDIVRRVPRSSPLVEMRVFAIAKKDPSEGRLICWPRALNGHTTVDPCPPTTLPSRDSVWHAIRRSSLGMEVDAVSYFHAFPLHADIAPAFGMRIPGFGKLALTVMPMGWNKSMGIATALSDLLARAVQKVCPSGLVTPWVDNFFLSAPDARAMALLWRAWKSVSGRVGLQTKGEMFAPRSRVRWLGLDVDLGESACRAPPEVVDRLLKAVSDAERSCSFRHAYQMLGAVNFFFYFLGLDAWDYPTLSRFQSRFGRLLGDRPELWDSACPVWPSFVSALRAAITRIGEWQLVPAESRSSPYLLYTDASLSGWGILSESRFAEGGTWDATECTDPIHRLEARALLRGVLRLSPMIPRGAAIRALVDNTICVHSMARGRCRDARTAEILRDAKRIASRRGQSLELRYVSTKEQLADPLSRGASAQDTSS